VVKKERGIKRKRKRKRKKERKKLGSPRDMYFSCVGINFGPGKRVYWPLTKESSQDARRLN
jgi:hypothetical protein